MHDYGLRISRLELAAFDGAGVALLFVKVVEVFLKDLVALVYGPRTVTNTISFLSLFHDSDRVSLKFNLRVIGFLSNS